MTKHLVSILLLQTMVLLGGAGAAAAPDVPRYELDVVLHEESIEVTVQVRASGPFSDVWTLELSPAMEVLEATGSGTPIAHSRAVDALRTPGTRGCRMIRRSSMSRSMRAATGGSARQGCMADLAGDRARARAEYELATSQGKNGSEAAAQLVRRFLEQPYGGAPTEG